MLKHINALKLRMLRENGLCYTVSCWPDMDNSENIDKFVVSVNSLLSDSCNTELLKLSDAKINVNAIVDYIQYLQNHFESAQKQWFIEVIEKSLPTVFVNTVFFEKILSILEKLNI